MLICKPKGRGNWKPITVHVDGARATLPMFVRVGELLTLGGVVWRICEVRP